ncbi:hypothetical protein SAMN04488058_1393 [Deinococcus reticulitermitis]|uniref:Uncharacterized protein n=1 Tax=Deinococcus reticulitermitis TaxID=856736 RepID=A0A1H7CZD9_9DEIO|nr:hypothetical protein SAMN04488058_1393 [Deinococcus reticulitermitis]
MTCILSVRGLSRAFTRSIDPMSRGRSVKGTWPCSRRPQSGFSYRLVPFVLAQDHRCPFVSATASSPVTVRGAADSRRRCGVRRRRNADEEMDVSRRSHRGDPGFQAAHKIVGRSATVEGKIGRVFATDLRHKVIETEHGQGAAYPCALRRLEGGRQGILMDAEVGEPEFAKLFCLERQWRVSPRGIAVNHEQEDGRMMLHQHQAEFKRDLQIGSHDTPHRLSARFHSRSPGEKRRWAALRSSSRKVT